MERPSRIMRPAVPISIRPAAVWSPAVPLWVRSVPLPQGARARASLSHHYKYISADLVTMHTRTMDLEKYALTITDEGSGMTWSVLLKNKDKSSEEIKERITYIQKQIGTKILHFKADGGGEFVN